MHLEIERKFLVPSEKLPSLPDEYEKLIQGYISRPEDSKEVRLRQTQNTYTMTIKSVDTFKRTEIEVPLSKEQFDELWPLTENRIIVKDRYKFKGTDRIYDLDLYKNELQSLIMVEVEFPDVLTAQEFEIPNWFGEEVTDNRIYHNRNLAVDGLAIL